MLLRSTSLVLAVLALAFLARQKQAQPTPPQDHRWQKVDASGNVIGLWQGPWHCVCDTETGLLWEIKNDSENIHEGNWTYSWFDGTTGAAEKGDCYFMPSRCDTSHLIRQINKQYYCNARDWRLPTPDELTTLLYAKAQKGDAQIDHSLFPYTRRGDYWTSQKNAPLPEKFRHQKRGAVAIDFAKGEKIVIPYKNATFVRLVTQSSRVCRK